MCFSKASASKNFDIFTTDTHDAAFSSHSLLCKKLMYNYIWLPIDETVVIRKHYCKLRAESY